MESFLPHWKEMKQYTTKKAISMKKETSPNIKYKSDPAWNPNLSLAHELLLNLPRQIKPKSKHANKTKKGKTKQKQKTIKNNKKQ